MSKRPRQPNRTLPLDRDGDGRNGGSLPGNQTAPMATDPDASPALDAIAEAEPELVAQVINDHGDGPDAGMHDTEIVEDDDAKLDAMERETDEANTAVREAAGWTRDEARLVQKLDDLGGAFADLSTEAVVQSWNDQEAFAAEAFADAMLAEGRYTSDDGEEFSADGTPIPLPSVLGAWEFYFEPTPEPAATFTAEEIASGRTPVAQEDEAEALAAELGVVIDPEDPIITVNTPTAPVAVRLKELQRLVDNRWLYKTRDGFSPNTHPPYIEDATAEVWVRAGLAQWDATAGNHGGIRVTAEARSLLVRKPEAAA